MQSGQHDAHVEVARQGIHHDPERVAWIELPVVD
jgi:hypothetical protein